MAEAMVNRLVFIAAGGTGGHVFPALAVAQGLRREGCEVQWLGTEKGLESRIATQHDFTLHRINVVGFRGKSIAYRLLAPLLLIKAVWRVARLIVQAKPVCLY